MTKVLVVAHALKNGGGISEWIKKYYNNMIVEYPDLEVDIVVESGIIDFEMNSKIRIIPIPNIKKNFVSYLKSWIKIKKNIDNYNFIHFHTDNLVKFFPYLILGKKENIIIHSHNSTNDIVVNNKMKFLSHKIGKKIIKKNNYIFFACSNFAAKWLFDSSEYIQVNNGIDIKKFKYSAIDREEYKQQLNVEKYDKIYGHIGRFMYQKNHEKLIDIYNEILKLNSNSLLIMIGTGEKQEIIKDKIKKMGIQNNVLFLNYREDVNRIINIFDFFIFPSRYEGLPISLIETQANGIKTFYSNKITNNVELTENIYSFDINDSNEFIASKIINETKLEEDTRKNAYRKVIQSGYSDKDVLRSLYNFYTMEGGF